MTNETITLNKRDFDSLLVYAFRYGVSRNTGALNQIKHIIINNAQSLSDNDKRTMLNDLDYYSQLDGSDNHTFMLIKRAIEGR